MKKRTFENQPSLPYEGEKPSYDNGPRKVLGAVCQGENGITQKDLIEDTVGNFHDSEGNIYQKVREIYQIVTEAPSPELSKIVAELERNNPGRNPDITLSVARNMLKARRRAELLEKKTNKKI